MDRDAVLGTRALGVREAVVALVVLAVGLWPFAQNLDLGLYRDDYLHMAELSGEGALPKTGKLSLFTFAEPIADRMGPVQGDYWPWWASDESSIDFFRPLASLSYVVQYAFCGADARAFLIGNMVLWAVVLLTVLALYRELARASGRGLLAAACAGLVFALDRAHEESVGWIAGRYGLVGLLFCVPALLAYHRWRGGGQRRHLVLMLVGLVLAMASCEMPVGLAGWFLAYELSLGRGSALARLRALAVPALAIGAYVVFYGLAGYGIVDSAWYLDPLREPGAFVTDGLGNRWPRLVSALLTSERVALEVRAAGWAPHVRILVPYATAAVVLVVLIVRSVRDEATRFALVGAVIGLVPVASSPMPPRQRVLLLATLGSAYALGVVLADALTRLRAHFTASAGRRPGLATTVASVVVAAIVVALHVVFEPGLMRSALAARRVSAELERRFALEAQMPADADAPDARVLLLNTPLDGVVATFLPIVREHHGHPWPGGTWPIALTPGPLALTRTGERSFELTGVDPARPQGFLSPGWVGVVREDTLPAVGTRFRQGVLEVEIAGVEDGKVSRLAVEIDRALDDRSVWLLAWSSDDGRWQRIAAPALGESVTLARVRPL